MRYSNTKGLCRPDASDVRDYLEACLTAALPCRIELQFPRVGKGRAIRLSPWQAKDLLASLADAGRAA